MYKHKCLMEKSTLLNTVPTEKINSYLSDGSFKVGAYGKNTIVHFSGEICNKLEIILEGIVHVERIDESGNLMTIAEFCNDEILGGNLLFSKNPYYPMTITTKTHAVILEIHKERLFEIFSDDPSFLRCYLEFVADHTTILGDRIQHYVNKSIRDCIMNYLEHEKQKQNSKKIRLPITKKAWAERMGVQRTSLLRELAKMKKDGLVRYDSKYIELL